MCRGRFGAERVCGRCEVIAFVTSSFVCTLHRLVPPSPNHVAPKIYTIFEGTSEIQRLIIARAISGVHIR